jgi:hypothetical protein
MAAPMLPVNVLSVYILLPEIMLQYGKKGEQNIS